MRTLSVGFPDKMMRALDRASISVGLPRSYLIRKAVESYLDEYAECRVALNRLQDKEDRVILGKELCKRL